MKRWLKIVCASAACAAALLAGCGGGGGDDANPPGGDTESPAPAPAPSEVPNELLRAIVTVNSGGVLDVPATAGALAGARVEIPAGAAIEDAEIQLGYLDQPPGPFRAEALGAGAVAVSKTIALKAASAKPSTFNRLVTITIPYDVAAANGLPPAVLYWDEAAGRYRAAAVIAVDRDKGLVTFQTSHFSQFLAAIVSTLGVEIPDAHTGFALGVDSILHPNFGSYQYGGHCAAFASMSTHYYSMGKPVPLYQLAQEGANEQPVDDELTRTALTLGYALIGQKWAQFAPSIVQPSAADTGLLMLASMLLTGDPLHLVMHSGSAGGHSVTAFGYDAASKSFRIYDSNFPKNEVSFDWETAGGFGTYSRAASYPPNMFDNIGYASDDTFGAPAQFQKIISEWESGKLKDYYSTIQVNDDQGTAHTLVYGGSFSTKIAYEDNQTVTGRFLRPAGSTNQVYLHVYYDGVQQAAPPIDASGAFTLSFPTKLENKVEVMVLVSEHPNDFGTGFSGFGKFSVVPDGKNFFVNFGFETGDLTGWNGASWLLYDNSTHLPTKLSVTGIGFDPIATDIPTSVFGQHALRINDETPNYHATFVAQTATVPASGNPQLVFQWAAVLEDPQHSPDDQPYVEVSVVNLSKGIDLYRKRFYTNDPSFTGWTDYRGGRWKAIPWQSVLLTGLSAHAGDQVELRIVGADCGLGAHGGYVYLDGEE